VTPQLPNPARSAAVLIGGSNYSSMPKLPGVTLNVAELADLLCDPHYWGLDPSRCTVVMDPVTPAEIVKAIAHAGPDCTDELVVYYAGHGFVDLDGELHLALRDSEDGHAHTALAYRYFSRALLGKNAPRTIVILDCCYSGSALGPTMSGEEDQLAAGATFAGACVITASAELERAQAPENERLTLFSGHLVRTLREGLPDKGSVLDLHSIYRRTQDTLAGHRLQSPQMRDRNGIAHLPFVRNVAWTPSTPGEIGQAASGNVILPSPRRTLPGPPRGRQVAARPFEFDGVAYKDPCDLVAAMVNSWQAAVTLVEGPQSGAFGRWLTEEVRDLTLPTNFLLQGTGDEKVARLAAHFTPDLPPVYAGRTVDASGIARLCAEAEAGRRQAATLVAGLTEPLLAVFARHPCQSEHSRCADASGCLVLGALAAQTADAWHGAIGTTTASAELSPYITALPQLVIGALPVELPHTPPNSPTSAPAAGTLLLRAGLIRAVLEPEYMAALPDMIEALPDTPRARWWHSLRNRSHTCSGPVAAAIRLLVLDQAANAAQLEADRRETKRQKLLAQKEAREDAELASELRAAELAARRAAARIWIAIGVVSVICSILLLAVGLSYLNEPQLPLPSAALVVGGLIWLPAGAACFARAFQIARCG
jgi:hypothetical protein